MLRCLFFWPMKEGGRGGEKEGRNESFVAGTKTLSVFLYDNVTMFRIATSRVRRKSSKASRGQ